jgi:signal transduction histidine kinase/CheY-like chemotaxis protein/HPt (histidine-containing phosphotransfer) domain-containing protein
MLLAVGLLSATGYLSYRKLSTIVSSINVDINPELRLVSIRDISMDLEKAQNSIRIYSITNDNQDLQPYYDVISHIDGKVSKLRNECKGDTILEQQTDTISKLIEENIVIWNRLLYLNNNQAVVKYLKTLSDRLNRGPDEVLQTENGILKRVFKRNNYNRLDETELKTDLQEIELQNRINKGKIMAREAELANTSSELKSQFYDLIGKIENEISGLVRQKAVAAQQQAHETYMWLALFLVSGTLLAVIVVFIIVRFVRKTEDYQVALQRSKEETEELARTKEQFMANMSHEIRTPVTAISGFTEQLLHHSNEENTLRILKVIKSSSDHLSRIINDILDFSKLQNGKLVLEKVNFRIDQVIQDVYSLFESQAKSDEIELSYSVSPEVPRVLLGDPYRLKQILINLVSNSVKFTKNGKVHYSVKAKVENLPDLELILEVVDTGIGIDEEKLSSVFEDFIQEEMSTTRKFGGTGLGLSIVKKLVDLQKGTIECASKKNHGTRITCNIPYRQGDEDKIVSEINHPVDVPDKVRALKILIVDDEEYNRMLFKMILERWGVQHSEASHGGEALKLLKDEHFDMIFMDARMPDIDGLEATRIIREEMKISRKELPVICISAATLNDNWQKYLDAGMNSFLSKPFTEEALLDAIVSVQNDPILTEVSLKPSDENKKDDNSKVNLENLYHISGNDDDLVRQLILSFTETTDKGLKEMDEAISAGLNGQAADIAHRLIPPCRHIGAGSLCKILLDIESNLKDNRKSSEAKQFSSRARREFEEISSILDTYVSKMS